MSPARTRPSAKKSPKTAKRSVRRRPTESPSYTTLPRLRSGPAVLVIHPWWGLNPFMRSLCDRLAREGFIVLAPDLYDGVVVTTVEDADKQVSGLKAEVVQAKLIRALDDLRSLSKSKSVGVVGFSLGAFWGLWLACARPDDVSAVVTFYGAREEDYGKARAAFQCHFAADDPYCTPAEREDLIKRLRAAQREVEIHDYPNTGHWFFEEDRPDAYNKGAATLAWRRTLGFLRSDVRA